MSLESGYRRVHGISDGPGRPGEIAYIGERLAVYTGGIYGWQRLRWWSGGARLVMRDLSAGEQEARRIYLKTRARERKGRLVPDA